MTRARKGEVPEGKAAPAVAANGFTLVEVLVVLGILTFLALIVAPQVIGYLGRAKTDTARLEIENIAAALDFYRLDVGSYPGEEQGLDALVNNPGDVQGWRGPYLKKAEAVDDPWRRDYRYRIPGEHGEFDLFTLGADDSPGGEDEDQDVGNW